MTACKGAGLTLLALRMEAGADSQRMQVASEEAGKGFQKQIFP